MCIQGELPLCVLPSDGSTTDKENMRSVLPSDGSTIDKENIRSVICVSTSIYLVYVRIPSKRITVFLTSIHLVYVRIPGRGSPCFD